MECVGAELKIEPLGNGKLSTDREVDLCKSETRNIVPSFVALDERWGIQNAPVLFGIVVQYSPTWGIRRTNPQRLAWNTIRARKHSSDSAQSFISCVKWESTSRNDD